MTIMVDILVLNYNDAETTISFVKSTEAIGIVDHILIVDNNSSDDSYDTIASTISSPKAVMIKAEKNGGYGYGNNRGIEFLSSNYKSKYILLCNPDVIVAESAIEAMVKYLEMNQDCAIVAPFMIDLNGNKQANTAIRVDSKWRYILSANTLINRFFHPIYYKNLISEKSEALQVGSVAGSLFLMRTEAMIDCGMYDENIFLYCEEATIGRKLLKRGWKVVLLPNESFIHAHSVSIKKTYESEIARRKILLTSKRYAIQNYFDANAFDLKVFDVLSALSMVEIRLKQRIRKR